MPRKTKNLEKHFHGFPLPIAIGFRISFINQVFENNETYPLLSTVGRKNKYNPNLKYDLIDINSFNPLMYQFNYSKSINQFFRIDNTDVLIMIKSTN